MEKLNQLLMEVKGMLAQKDEQIQRIHEDLLRARGQIEMSRFKIIQLADMLTSAQRTIKRLEQGDSGPS